jgi:hypothetical protein
LVKPGTWANSISLLALARAIKVELRIFAWSAGEDKWQLHVLRPPADKSKKAKTPQVVWLVLERHHHRWPKVVAKVPDSVVKDAIVLDKDIDNAAQEKALKEYFSQPEGEGKREELPEGSDEGMGGKSPDRKVSEVAEDLVAHAMAHGMDLRGHVRTDGDANMLAGGGARSTHSAASGKKSAKSAGSAAIRRLLGLGGASAAASEKSLRDQVAVQPSGGSWV